MAKKEEKNEEGPNEENALDAGSERSVPDEDQNEVQGKKDGRSPVKLVTVLVLIISLLFMGWYIVSDRYVPYTDQAKINGLMLPIMPRVAGNITEIHVDLHNHVQVGDTLFQIDRRPFVLAVEKAEANLDHTAQNVAARTASVKSSAGRLGMARAQLDRAQRNWDRVQKVLMENPGALSQSDRDQAETALSQATEQVASAEADLERSQQAVGFSGAENAQFRAAMKALEQAQLDLAFTTIIADSDGYIESLTIDVGFYASPGQPLATLVSDKGYWIQANMKENNLSKMQAGDMVEFALDVSPGKVFKGRVESIGYGVSSGNTNRGDLPRVTGSDGWLRDPQRFPVVISYEDGAYMPPFRLGGQVDVIVYTGDHWFLNAIGKFWIRFTSWLSYAR
jgi:multidrug resistance efflux pump